MTENKKRRLKERREKGLCEIDDFCSLNEIEKTSINEYQVRVFGKKIIDIFPTNKRYCILGTNPVWGDYKDLNELLKYLKS